TPGGPNRALYFGIRGMVSAHCIYSNGEHVRNSLLLFDFDHFSSLVLAAMGAHPVGQLRLVTVRTFRKTGRLQRIVSGAVRSPPLGVSTFGIRHLSTSTTSYNLEIFRVLPAILNLAARPTGHRRFRACNRTWFRSGSCRKRGKFPCTRRYRLAALAALA